MDCYYIKFGKKNILNARLGLVNENHIGTVVNEILCFKQTHISLLLYLNYLSSINPEPQAGALNPNARINL